MTNIDFPTYGEPQSPNVDNKCTSLKGKIGNTPPSRWLVPSYHQQYPTLDRVDSYLNKIWEILFQKYWGRYYQVVKRLLQKLLSPPREHNHKTWATGTSAQGEYREFGSIVASDAFVTWSRFGKYLWFGKIRSKYIYRNLGPWLLNLGSKYHSWKKISGGKRDSMKINPWWKFFFAFWIFFSTLIKDLIVKN